jgi:histidinol-phosphatase
MNPRLDNELALALELADAADEITKARYRASDLTVEEKPDRTPVTEADKATERALRAALEVRRPSHGIVGEEYGASGDSPWTWVLDPIDGTMNYVRGIPVWATLIALVTEGRPAVGVVSAPALHRRWWAALGLGAYVNGERITVSRIRHLEDAQLSLNAIRDFEQHGRSEALRSITDRVWRIRGFGDFWSHMLVAEGAVDIAVEAAVHPWDMAAVQIIVEEAGGRYTDLTGAPEFAGGSALSTNGLLHNTALDAFV